MGLFRAAHGWGGQKGPPLSKICRAYPTLTKLSTVIPYLKKIHKILKSRDTPLEFYWFFHRKSVTFSISRNTCIDCILMHKFWVFFNFFESSKVVSLYIVEFLMMSPKLATLGLFEIKLFLKKRLWHHNFHFWRH